MAKTTKNNVAKEVVEIETPVAEVAPVVEEPVAVVVAPVAKTPKYVEVSYTAAEAAQLTAEEIFGTMENRISQERARDVIPQLIGAARVKFSGAAGAATVMNWSYKRIFISDVAYEGLGKKTPEVSLTLAQFAQLTPTQLGEYFKERISPEKAKDVMKALLQPNEEGDAVVKLKSEEMVRLSYNRVAIEGIEPEWNHGKGGTGAAKQAVSIAGVSA